MNLYFFWKSQNNDLHMAIFESFSQIITSFGQNFLMSRFRRSRCVDLCIGHGRAKIQPSVIFSSASAGDLDRARSKLFRGGSLIFRRGAQETTKAQMTSQKKTPFAIFKKEINLTIDLLSLGIYAPGPQVLSYRTQILRGVRI